MPGFVAVSTGEPLPPRLAESLLDRTACLWNMYGPAETTVWSTGDRVERGAPITIGRPLDNTRTYVLSRAREPVPVGVAGELAIAGDGVALGYLNRPELMDERFVLDPFVAGERMYLTGDLARYRPDGRIEHLGRLDQIKIRGFRVEPGEIEAENENGTGAATPRDTAEERMAAIWARTLGVEELGMHYDFFALGGNSLLALRLLVEVRREFGVDLPVTSVFDSPTLTVASLTAKIEMARDRGTRGGTGADRPEPESTIVFFVQPWDRAVAALRHFAKALGPSYRLVGLVPECIGGRFDRSRSIEELARPLLDTVRKNQAHGPYYIAGYSVGGLLAYEMAGRLRAEGEHVAWLGLLDAATPAWMRHTFSFRQKVARQLRGGPREAIAAFDEDFRREVASRLMPKRSSRMEITERFDLTGATWLTVRYGCEPHDTALDLFIAESVLLASDRDTLGWSELHLGPVHVHRIGVDHLAMMTEGNVEAVAAMVSAGLKDARLAYGG